MPPNQRSSFFRLNKSSSLHDIAHEEAMASGHSRIPGPGGGGGLNDPSISWIDQPWTTTQSTMNQPTMNVHELLQQQQQRNFRRASSTKSLHQQPDVWESSTWDDERDEPWNSRSVITGSRVGGPQSMINSSMMFGGGGGMVAAHPGQNHLHRSMHELHLGGGGMGGVPDSGGPPFNHHSRGASPAHSQKSKKSIRSDRFSHRVKKNKAARQNRDREMQQQQHHHNNHKLHHHEDERPHSRSHSRNASSKSGGRMRRYSNRSSGLRRDRDRSISSEEDDDIDRMDSDEAVANDDFDNDDLDDEDEDEEDFFTGESDNDFVSLSSGSNSKRTPRRSWTCDHCTYVNNPGVAVCAVCCKTSSKLRSGEDSYFQDGGRSGSRASTGSRRGKKNRNRSKYDSSDEDVSERRRGSTSKLGGGGVARGGRRNPNSNHVDKAGGGGSKTNSLKRKSAKTRKQHAKSPMPEYNVSDDLDLEQDAMSTYYAVRHHNANNNKDVDNGDSSDDEQRRFNETSSETSSMQNNNSLRKPNFDAPAPAKGILKKASSNPHLSKLELDNGQQHPGGASEMGVPTKGLQKHFPPPGKVVDIKKYLAQNQKNHHHQRDNGIGNDIWQQEKANWMQNARDMSPSRSTMANAPENDYMSDVASNSSENLAASMTSRKEKPRMTRSVSGYSLTDLEYLQQLEQQQQQQQGGGQRRASEVGPASGGKKNFRSKRFSRNMEREPALRRAQSLHMDRSRFQDGGDNTFVETQKGTIRRQNGGKQSGSGSSGEDATLHFTATVEGQSEVIGSYLSRQEFGSTEGQQPIGDSGYISHGSGASGPQKSQLPVYKYLSLTCLFCFKCVFFTDPNAYGVLYHVR